MLFSEPKIPQSAHNRRQPERFGPFSALQRAENSSIETAAQPRRARWPFSALQRAENSSMYFAPTYKLMLPVSFSALQRAENSSIMIVSSLCNISYIFQCSSASRKFLNRCAPASRAAARPSPFSALQRAENSSMRRRRTRLPSTRILSVLFSEPKIPQCRGSSARCGQRELSVLFSEPKIPQLDRRAADS